MRYLTVLFVLFAFILADAQGVITRRGGGTAGGGGLDTWTFSLADSSDYNTQNTWSDTWKMANDITLTSAGTVDSFMFKIAMGVSVSFIIEVYYDNSGTWTKVSCDTVTPGGAPTGDIWVKDAMDATYNNSASETLRMSVVPSSGSGSNFMYCPTGLPNNGWYIETAYTCDATEASWNADEDVGMGLHQQ